MSDPAPKVGAIAIVYHEGRFLMAQRGKTPGRGMWGFPGGHVEFGETARDAAIRELREETTVTARPLRYLTCFDVIGADHHYLIAAVLCRYESGEPRGMDDAMDARWMSIQDLEELGSNRMPQVLRVAKLAIEALDPQS